MDGMTPLHSWTPLPGNIDTDREHFKRAVLRAPPPSFSIEFLLPSYKGSHNHGMRITSVTCDDSSSVISGNWEYEIWRNWEDILWLQETLESEYSRAAREKKVRLAQGKGVKSINGMYKQDMASSWESLPPGPLPSSVAQDIHKHLPRVSKRGTVFRASRSTIDQRQKEFRALLEALFSNDLPSLIKELRMTRQVTDFFGLWRRDYDTMEKSPKSIGNSVTISVFSSYFSESRSTLALSNKASAASSTISTRVPSTISSRASSTISSRASSTRRPRSAGNSSTKSTVHASRRNSADGISSSGSIKLDTITIKRLSGSSDEGVPVGQASRPRALSNNSSDSSSTHSDGGSENGSTIEDTPTIVEDSPITFNHNPHVPVDRCSSVLEVLPEEREMLAKSPETYLESPQKQQSITSTHRRSNRSWQVMGTPVNKTNFGEGKRHVRTSCQSRTSIDSSADAFLDGIGVSLPSIKENDYDYRASIYTVLTTNSADGVLPRESLFEPVCPRSQRVSNTVSLSEFEIYPAVEEENSTQDAVPFPSLPSPTDRAQTGRPRLSLDVPTTPTSPTCGRNHEDSSFECLPSPTSANVPTSPTMMSPTSGGLLSIKAAHNSSIIMLRVSRDTPFEDVRQRLYNKFVGQEGIPLSKEFAVAMVVPSNAPLSPAKSSSSKLSRSLSVSSTDKMELHFIDSHYDWEQVVLIKDTSKVALRILDTPRI